MVSLLWEDKKVWLC